MKIATKISTITLLTSSLLLAEGHYAVKSAKIEFEIKSTQTVGSISKEETGTKRIVIDNYGEQELEELNTVIKHTTSGKTEVDKIHNIKYINGKIRYVADFDKKTMNRSTNYMGMLYGTKKYKGSVDNMLELQKMKKVGTDMVAGHKCDVWQLGKMSKTCFYKGFPLREETTLMGMKRVVIATKAEFDLTLSKDDFKMPNFPINGKKFSQSELDTMDKKYIDDKKKEDKETSVMMKIMNDAYAKAGVIEGKAPTKEQMNMAKEYMQNAMFPMQKKKMLEEGKMLKKIKPCYEKAQNIKEAKQCDPQNDELYQWNDSVKKEILADMEIAEKMFSCAEKSSTGAEMSRCFPEDD